MLTLGHFIVLSGLVVGGKRLGPLVQVGDHLCQVIKVTILTVFRSALRFIVCGQGGYLSRQAVDLLSQGGQLRVLGVVIHGGNHRLGPGFQRVQIVNGGQRVHPGLQCIQACRACLIRTRKFVGLFAKGLKLILQGRNLLALNAFNGLICLVVGSESLGLLIQGLDLLTQGGQLSVLGSLVLRGGKGVELCFQGRYLLSLLLITGHGVSVRVFQGRHPHLIRVPCRDILAEALLNSDDVDHQKNDDGEKGQGDSPVEQRFQKGRHLRTSSLLRHARSPLREEA